MCLPNYSGLVSCLLHNAVSPYLQAAPKHTASLFERVLLATFGPSYERNSPKFHEFLSFLPTSSLPYHHPRWIMDSSCGVLPVEYFPLTLLTSSSLSPLLLLKATGHQNGQTKPFLIHVKDVSRQCPGEVPPSTIQRGMPWISHTKKTLPQPVPASPVCTGGTGRARYLKFSENTNIKASYRVPSLYLHQYLTGNQFHSTAGEISFVQYDTAPRKSEK